MSNSSKPADNEVYDLNLNSAVKALKNESDLRPFRFIWGPDNKRFEMAHRETLNQLKIMEAFEQSEVHGVLEQFRQAMGPKQWAEFRKIPLPPSARDKIMEDYGKHCGVVEGE
jgi:hypothetical protein